MQPKEFIAITRERFNDIDGMSSCDVTATVWDLAKDAIWDCNVEIVKVIIAGSRSRGLEHEGSDLDVIVAFESEEWDEDGLFNLLHEEEFFIGNVPVDFNPIEYERLEDYLDSANSYLAEKARQ